MVGTITMITNRRISSTANQSGPLDPPNHITNAINKRGNRRSAERAKMMLITIVATTRHMLPLCAPPMAIPPEIQKNAESRAKEEMIAPFMWYTTETWSLTRALLVKKR